MDQKPFYPKYKVERTDGQPILGPTVTIELDRDPQAVEALLALARVYRLERPEFAKSLYDQAVERVKPFEITEFETWENVIVAKTPVKVTVFICPDDWVLCGHIEALPEEDRETYEAFSVRELEIQVKEGLEEDWHRLVEIEEDSEELKAVLNQQLDRFMNLRNTFLNLFEPSSPSES